VHLPPPADRSRPRPRRGTLPLDEREALKDLADHVAPYTDIEPPMPATEEPWYDARYEPPAEGHGRPRDSHYPIAEPPDYTTRREPVDDYGPKLSVFRDRMPPPRPAPPERPPTYEDTVRAGRLTWPLWAQPAPAEDAPGSSSDPSADAIPEQDLPTDVVWEPMIEPAFPEPAIAEPLEQAPGLDGLLNADLTSPPMAEDPLALANQAFDEQMRQAFSPPPEPDPWAGGLSGYGGLEQHLLEPPGMLPELPPFPDLPPI
jgi:hypothetical protein